MVAFPPQWDAEIWMNDEAFRISGNIAVVNWESDLPWRNREKQ